MCDKGLCGCEGRRGGASRENYNAARKRNCGSEGCNGYYYQCNGMIESYNNIKIRFYICILVKSEHGTLVIYVTVYYLFFLKDFVSSTYHDSVSRRHGHQSRPHSLY